MIEFQDDFKYKKWCSKQNIIKNKIKNPYEKTFYNKGFLGEGKHNIKNSKKAFVIWNGMLSRCYKKENKTYIDVEICDEWCNFQNFASWFENNYIEGLVLDKDLKKPENKKYSPEYCIFLPPKINSFITIKKRKKLKTGVSKRKNKFTAETRDFNTGKRLFLGYFDNEEEAYQAYIKEKEKQYKEAEKYLKELNFKNEIIKNIYYFLNKLKKQNL